MIFHPSFFSSYISFDHVSPDLVLLRVLTRTFTPDSNAHAHSSSRVELSRNGCLDPTAESMALEARQLPINRLQAVSGTANTWQLNNMTPSEITYQLLYVAVSRLPAATTTTVAATRIAELTKKNSPNAELTVRGISLYWNSVEHVNNHHNKNTNRNKKNCFFYYVIIKRERERERKKN